MPDHVLILCGGKGTRFRDVSTQPKILAPFKNGKFLDWLIMYISSHGFSELTLSLSYKADQIIQYARDKINTQSIKINFCIERTPLGTGGAVKNFFDTSMANELIVVNGDTFWPDKIPLKFIKRKAKKALCLTTLVKCNDRFGDFKIVDGTLRYQRGSSEKPIKSSDSFVGICKINQNINFLNLHPPFSLEELLIHQTNGVELIKSDFNFFDFGTTDSYRDLLLETNDL